MLSTDELTTRLRARSNTALFGPANGDEANLPTLEDAARAAPWFSRAQSQRWRAQSAAQPSRTRPAPHRVVVAAGKRFGLDASRRLRQKDDFENLLRQGSRRSLNGYTFYVARRERGEARLGLLVSRRHAARAVVRNRIKRCIREAFRLTQGELGALDILVRPPYGAEPSSKMVAQLRAILPRLKP